MTWQLPNILRFNKSEVMDTAGIMIKEPMAARSAEKMRKVNSLILDKETNSGHISTGELSEDHYFLRVPFRSQLYMEAKPVHITGSFNPSLDTCICSKRYHRVLSVKTLCDVADAVTMEAVIYFVDGAKRLEVKISGLTGAIDFGLFDNDFSSSFVADAFIVLKSKILELLLDVPKRVYLLTAIISGFVGMVIGALGMAFIIAFLLFMAGK